VSIHFGSQVHRLKLAGGPSLVYNFPIAQTLVPCSQGGKIQVSLSSFTRFTNRTWTVWKPNDVLNLELATYRV